MVLLLRRYVWGLLASLLAGVMIMGFEIVVVWVIGSPVGLVRNLQLFYFTLGLVIFVLAVGLWMAEHGGALLTMRQSKAY